MPFGHGTRLNGTLPMFGERTINRLIGLEHVLLPFLSRLHTVSYARLRQKAAKSCGGSGGEMASNCARSMP